MTTSYHLFQVSKTQFLGNLETTQESASLTGVKNLKLNLFGKFETTQPPPRKKRRQNSKKTTCSKRNPKPNKNIPKPNPYHQKFPQKIILQEGREVLRTAQAQALSLLVWPLEFLLL